MAGDFEVAWIDGLGGAPGGVDLISTGPEGGIANRAVTFDEASVICESYDRAHGTMTAARLTDLGRSHGHVAGMTNGSSRSDTR